MNKLFFITFILLIQFDSFSSTTYKKYSEEIQVSEKYIIENKLDSALNNYLKVLKKYNYPYAKQLIQASYISCYVGDKSKLIFLITKAIERGMTKNEYDFIVKVWNYNNNDRLNFNLFIEKRSIYLKKLNKLKMGEYIKLDLRRKAIRSKIMKTSELRSEYYTEMKQLRDQYVRLINIYGYINDKETGRKLSYKQVRKPGKDNAKIFFIPLNQTGFCDSIFSQKYIKFNSQDPKAIWLSSDVGSWFLTHYINRSDINKLDTFLYKEVKSGVNELKLPVYLLINMKESTRLIENDFALTYYSRTLLESRMNYFERYNVPDKIKKNIDKNRMEYGIRTLSQEEKLLRALFKLKTNKNLPHRFKNKDLNPILKENGLFISYMV